MSWPPKIGEPLPRAEGAWYEPAKLERWILSARGHGPELRRVFQVGVEDSDRVWNAIARSIQAARITTVRDRGADGVVCGAVFELTIGGRTAPVTTSWHYATEASPPRLVTAYVTL